MSAAAVLGHIAVAVPVLVWRDLGFHRHEAALAEEFSLSPVFIGRPVDHTLSSTGWLVLQTGIGPSPTLVSARASPSKIGIRALITVSPLAAELGAV